MEKLSDSEAEEEDSESVAPVADASSPAQMPELSPLMLHLQLATSAPKPRQLILDPAARKEQPSLLPSQLPTKGRPTKSSCLAVDWLLLCTVLHWEENDD